ncbi:MAG: putative signal transducing protein [Mangrovibacterium sp.]
MKNKLTRIYSGTEVTVNLLKGILEEEGIAALIRDDFRSGVTAGFSGGVPSAIDLFINETDLEKAEPIVKEFLSRNS